MGPQSLGPSPESLDLRTGGTPCTSKNGGDRRPRFWRDAAVTASCRPFSSRPSLLSLPLCFIPPFVWDSSARSILRIAAPLPSGTSAGRLPAPDASLLTPPPWSRGRSAPPSPPV